MRVSNQKHPFNDRTALMKVLPAALMSICVVHELPRHPLEERKSFGFRREASHSILDCRT